MNVYSANGNKKHAFIKIFTHTMKCNLFTKHRNIKKLLYI